MTDESFLSWPFFETRHADLRSAVARFAEGTASGLIDHDEVDRSCRALVRALGEAGLLRHAVTAPYGGAQATLDVRSLCLARETLAYHDGLADFAFAMQGLGTGPVTLAGTEEQKRRWLPKVAEGHAIAAFALSEPEAGSDLAALSTTATPDGPDHVRLDGIKTWISNGGIADHYVVFARTGEGPGTKGLSAFMVEGDARGLDASERIETIAPHPLATLRFDGCRIPIANRIGAGGDGFKIAMATLDVFRSTVGAAALGFARRAFDEAVARAGSRRMLDGMLGDLQMTQAAIAEMAADVDSAALLIYRAAWTKDSGAARVTREAALAKFVATEAAQRVVDRAVQLHGGLGVMKGSKVEALYRDVRALRIYEGATEVQKVIVAKSILRERERTRG
ncbi:MAG: acyl-CoA dehydrogenase family protein [Alphaproteobacteria bacterium]